MTKEEIEIEVDNVVKDMRIISVCKKNSKEAIDEKAIKERFLLSRLEYLALQDVLNLSDKKEYSGMACSALASIVYSYK